MLKVSSSCTWSYSDLLKPRLPGLLHTFQKIPPYNFYKTRFLKTLDLISLCFNRISFHFNLVKLNLITLMDVWSELNGPKLHPFSSDKLPALFQTGLNPTVFWGAKMFRRRKSLPFFLQKKF